MKPLKIKTGRDRINMKYSPGSVIIDADGLDRYILLKGVAATTVADDQSNSVCAIAGIYMDGRRVSGDLAVAEVPVIENTVDGGISEIHVRIIIGDSEAGHRRSRMNVGCDLLHRAEAFRLLHFPVVEIIVIAGRIG